MHTFHVHEAEGTGIVYDGAFHAPLVKEDVLDEGVGNTGNAVVGVVGRHHRLGTSLGTLPETVAVILTELLLVKAGVGAVAVIFVGVSQEVLHQGGGTPVSGVVSLDALHLGGYQFANQEGIFAEAFLGAAPAGVTGQVGIGGPEDEGLAGIVFGIETGLVGHYVTYNPGHFTVPGFAYAVGLRECRAVLILRRYVTGPVAAAKLAGIAGVGQLVRTTFHDAVDSLGGTGVGYSQTGNTLTHYGTNLLVHRHQGDGVVKALLFGELGVLERILLGLQEGR